MSAISRDSKYRSPTTAFSSRSYASEGSQSYAISTPSGIRFTGAWSPTLSGRAVIEGNHGAESPIKTGLDPEVQHVKIQEKEQLKHLNHKFAHFIDKVRMLEQQNQVLKTKWSILQSQKIGPSNMENMLKAWVGSLQKQLEGLGQEKASLEAERGNMEDLVAEFKTKFEEEINNRAEKENDFVQLKKDLDEDYISRQKLEVNAQSLTDEINFLTQLYAKDLCQVQACVEISNTPMVIAVERRPTLDVAGIIAEAREQYEAKAKESREGARRQYETRHEQVQQEADRHGEELRATRAELSELQRTIHRLQADITALKEQRARLEAALAQAEEQGQQAVADVTAKLQSTTQALQKAKQHMARQMQEYHVLANLKLALDIEIATYSKLLEGEESRLESSR
ncbi:keratin, type II cytoskeletal 8-like [Pelodiscus sinensis]|uniref:keratin, type II cytoskeletal 8-like n=1 Tax=Pelodiscus sinensis TaxID=13735 RepID=UPI003F6C4AA9